MKGIYIGEGYSRPHIAYCSPQSNVAGASRSYSQDYYDGNIKELSFNIMLYHEMNEKRRALLEIYLYDLLIKGKAYA